MSSNPKIKNLALILFISRSISIRTGNELVDNFHALYCPLRRISVFTVGKIKGQKVHLCN